MKKLNLESVVVISNYFNHHQKPLADAFFNIYGDGYRFIETTSMTEERKNMGWGESIYPQYVIQYDEFAKNKETYIKLINDADVVIIGSASNSFIAERIKSKKVIFRYSERPLKDNTKKWKHLFRLYTWRKLNPQKGFMHLLCSSAFASADYAKMGLFKNKAYKWGYFTEVKKYENVDSIITEKEKNSILWCARLIPLKHPELTVAIAKRLKAEGYKFKLSIIGNGEMESILKEEIIKEKLEDYIDMLGTMKPEEVRREMEKNEIFFFTSDRNEGWGAVLNEAMNSACAVVASSAIGSVPFLVNDNENGLIYKDGDVDELYNKIKLLIDNSTERKRVSKNAYLTMVTEWNAENASQKFAKLAECVLNKEDTTSLFDAGVCSLAENLKDDWYAI